jgi:CRISPR-associated protein Csx3
MAAIELTVEPCLAASGLHAQRLVITLTTKDTIVQPENLKRLEWKQRPTPGLGVILDGSAPNWIFATLTAICRQSGAPWVASFEPRREAAIVIDSGDPAIQPGDLLALGSTEHKEPQAGEWLLEVNEIVARNAATYQRLEIFIAGAVSPSILRALTLPGNLDLTRGVVLWGAAPVWLYARLAVLCRNAPWVGIYNIREGSFVIVSTQSTTSPSIGDALQLVTGPQCPAILIGGPPHSGKSVLATALDRGLRREFGTGIHLHRAQWDGEGDWFVEMYADPEARARADALRKSAKAEPTGHFFLGEAAAVSNAREVSRLVLVDFGGEPKSGDLPLLHRCTHYIVISNSAALLPQWHDFCASRGGLQCLAVVHSTLEQKQEVLQHAPYLEMTAGPWNRGQQDPPPQELLLALGRLLRQD